MSKQKIVIEFEMPDNRDLCWDNNYGLQAFSEVFNVDNAFTLVQKVAQVEKLKAKNSTNPQDIAFIEYLEMFIKIRESLSVYGVLDKDDNFIKYTKGIGLEGTE